MILFSLLKMQMFLFFILGRLEQININIFIYLNRERWFEIGVLWFIKNGHGTIEACLSRHLCRSQWGGCMLNVWVETCSIYLQYLDIKWLKVQHAVKHHLMCLQSLSLPVIHKSNIKDQAVDRRYILFRISIFTFTKGAELTWSPLLLCHIQHLRTTLFLLRVVFLHNVDETNKETSEKDPVGWSFGLEFLVKKAILTNKYIKVNDDATTVYCSFYCNSNDSTD